MYLWTTVVTTVMQNQPQLTLHHAQICCLTHEGWSKGTQLFVPKNKEEQVFLHSSAWVSYCMCQGISLAHTKIFLYLIVLGRNKKTEQGTRQGCEKEWDMCKMCKTQKKSENRVFCVSENIAVSRHESWKGRDGTMYKRNRDYLAKKNKDGRCVRWRNGKLCYTEQE